MSTVSRQTLLRLSQYLNYLRTLPPGTEYISATALALALNLGEVQVRKDLAAVSHGGRPKVGYAAGGLICDIEAFLKCGSPGSAVIVGAGNLGRALLDYEGFSAYGLEVVAAFDTDPARLGADARGRAILPVALLGEVCREKGVSVGILTVPAAAAQAMCGVLIEAGVKAVWNFAPVHLKVPEGVLVRSENMAVSLAVLSQCLAERRS